QCPKSHGITHQIAGDGPRVPVPPERQGPGALAKQGGIRAEDLIASFPLSLESPSFRHPPAPVPNSGAGANARLPKCLQVRRTCFSSSPSIVIFVRADASSMRSSRDLAAETFDAGSRS